MGIITGCLWAGKVGGFGAVGRGLNNILHKEQG